MNRIKSEIQIGPDHFLINGEKHYMAFRFLPEQLIRQDMNYAYSMQHAFLYRNYWQTKMFVIEDYDKPVVTDVYEPSDRQLNILRNDILPAFDMLFNKRFPELIVNIKRVNNNVGLCMIDEPILVTHGMNLWMTEDYYLTHVLRVV